MEKASPSLTEFFVSGLNLFTNIAPIILLYFFYGLSFLFLGVAIVVKDKTASKLRLANCLWLLAAFGFAHGSHEWLELYLLLQGQHVSVQETFIVNFGVVFVVVLSFFFLLQFGLSLILSAGNNRLRWLKMTPVIFIIVSAIYLWNHGFSIDNRFFAKTDILARNTFGFVSGLATAYGLITYSHKIKDLSRFASRNLFYAGITFAFYGIFTGTIASRTVLPYIPVPVEALRGISAILIACFIIKALDLFDVEKAKKLEHNVKRLAQSEKLASLGQLAAGIAHEINNPLANASLNIQTLTGKLKNITTDSDILQELEAVERNVDRASIIAKDLLQFSREREFRFTPLNINDIITGALSFMGFKLDEVTIHQSLSDVPCVTGDPVKLEQVFINILYNSVEAMPDGGDISISTSYNNGWVIAEVIDSGTGMHEDRISKAFDPFFTTKDIGEGTGLGLSICYGIINQHNGVIEISSIKGKGTTVTIKLPAKEKDYEKNPRS